MSIALLFTDYRIARREGAVFLSYYAVYVTWLVLDATDHHAREELGLALLGFALPLTVLTLAVVTVRSLREGSSLEEEDGEAR